MAKIKQQFLCWTHIFEKYYTEGNEKDRLSAHRLEKDRTLQILKKLLPAAPAVIFDVREVLRVSMLFLLRNRLPLP